jgi:hypothetical protein
MLLDALRICLLQPSVSLIYDFSYKLYRRLIMFVIIVCSNALYHRITIAFHFHEYLFGWPAVRQQGLRVGVGSCHYQRQPVKRSVPLYGRLCLALTAHHDTILPELQTPMAMRMSDAYLAASG